MHYHAEVWVPSLNGLDQQLQFIMEPYREGDTDGGFWDWYQIGGRYTGTHDSNYDPAKDPANIETCRQCEGTGFRSDSLGIQQRADTPSYTCNGCGEFKDGKWQHGPYGPGKSLKWPTEWRRVKSDVIPVSAVSEALTAFTLIVAGEVLTQEKWDGHEWAKTDFPGLVKPQLEKRGVKDGYLVTVDYHS